MNDKKQKIIDVALELFLKNGFNGTSVEVITSAAGIAKGSFYTYFSSKEELLNEIVSDTILGIENDLSVELNKENDPVLSIKKFLDINKQLAEKYVPGILLALKETDFSSLSDKSGIAGGIVSKIKSLLKKFVVMLKGKCSDEDLVFIWGIVLSFWIETAFEGKSPDTGELAERIWYGLGGVK